MATRKRRRSTRRVHARRNPVNPVNPTRRRKRTTRRNAHYTRSRHHNPVRRYHRRGRRRRNPITGSIVMTGFRLAAAGAVIGIAQPFVRQFAAPYLGASPIASAGITFGTAWGLSFLAKAFGPLRRYENDLLIAGATIAGAQLISAYVTPYLRLGGGANPMMGQPRHRRNWRGVNGIAAVSDLPPRVVLPPPSRQANNGANMQGFAQRPGVYRR